VRPKNIEVTGGLGRGEQIDAEHLDVVEYASRAHWLAHINGVMQHHRPGGRGQQYQRNRYPQWGKADSGC
jgi:hypothetical protein